jgi:hypothetical protein
MAVATVTIRPSLPFAAFVEGKYVCDASPSATYVNVGFVPSRVELINATDKDVLTIWTSDMTDAHAMVITTAAAAITSGGITPVAGTDGTNHGFLVGTDAGCQEASKTFTFRAFR